MPQQHHDANMTKREMLAERGIIKADPAENLRFQAEMPRGFSLNLCSHCNYRCNYCPQGVNAQPVEFLGIEIVEKLVRDLGGKAVYVQMSARGESLLHPQFFEIVDHIKKASGDSFICLNTNGSRVDTGTAEQLVACGIDQLQFSLQTMDPGLYRELTGSPYHERVVAAIINLAEMTRAMDAKPLLNVQYMDISKNRPYRRDFFDFCKAHDIDFHVQELHSWGDEFEAEVIGDPDRYPCPYLFLYPTVNHAGVVNPCFIDFHAKHAFGSLAQDSLTDIWHSGRARAMRAKHLQGHWHDIPMCRNCRGYRLIPNGFSRHNGQFTY